MKYELREAEFITLFGSYCNILIRIFNRIPNPKRAEEFIKAVVELSINGSSQQDKRYIEALKASAQFERIANFYKAIYKDSNAYIASASDDKLFSFRNDKFNKLIKWTLKNFSRNLNEK